VLADLPARDESFTAADPPVANGWIYGYDPATTAA